MSITFETKTEEKKKKINMYMVTRLFLNTVAFAFRFHKGTDIRTWHATLDFTPALGTRPLQARGPDVLFVASNNSPRVLFASNALYNAGIDISTGEER